MPVLKKKKEVNSVIVSQTISGGETGSTQEMYAFGKTKMDLDYFCMALSRFCFYGLSAVIRSHLAFSDHDTFAVAYYSSTWDTCQDIIYGVFYTALIVCAVGLFISCVFIGILGRLAKPVQYESKISCFQPSRFSP